MRDSYDADPEETTKKLRQVRARDAQLWGRTVATPEVTPTMVKHTDVGRCICDACDGARPQALLPAALSNRTLVNRNRLAASVASQSEEPPGRPYGKRKPNRLNSPVRVPVWSTFLNKCMR